ncbi:MAG: hypothetical protein NTV34_21020, partial [Proteobacteria bacterium]|nr:hypothetical protein [Pseudomonadota bacterium]
MELEISIPSPLGQSFTYYHPELLAPGVRVKVAFSSQGKTIGVVLGSQPDQDPSTRSFKLKCISEVIDLEPAYSPAMLELGRWLSSYYLHPLGEVLRTMLPASKTKSSKATLELLAVPSEEDLGPNSLNPAVFFNRKTALSLLTLKSKLKGQGHIGKIQDKIIKNWLKQG